MHDTPTTIVGLLHVHVHIPLSNSLKDKRSVLRSCTNHLQREWNLSVAEVGDQDIWRSAILAMAVVSNNKLVVEQQLCQAREYLANRHDLEFVASQLEII